MCVTIRITWVPIAEGTFGAYFRANHMSYEKIVGYKTHFSCLSESLIQIHQRQSPFTIEQLMPCVHVDSASRPVRLRIRDIDAMMELNMVGLNVPVVC